MQRDRFTFQAMQVYTSLIFVKHNINVNDYDFAAKVMRFILSKRYANWPVHCSSAAETKYFTTS